MNPKRIKEIFKECHFPASEQGTDIVCFNKNDLERYRQEIKDCLDELPEKFKEGGLMIHLSDLKAGGEWTNHVTTALQLGLLSTALGLSEIDWGQGTFKIK